MIRLSTFVTCKDPGHGKWGVRGGGENYSLLIFFLYLGTISLIVLNSHFLYIFEEKLKGESCFYVFKP